MSSCPLPQPTSSRRPRPATASIESTLDTPDVLTTVGRPPVARRQELRRPLTASLNTFEPKGPQSAGKHLVEPYHDAGDVAQHARDAGSDGGARMPRRERVRVER